jgi:hypothetical protein
MLEVAQCFFRIRAVGQKTGFITSWGGGAFGFMRSLALLGPLTVPQIAQMRPRAVSACSVWRMSCGRGARGIAYADAFRAITVAFVAASYWCRCCARSHRQRHPPPIVIEKGRRR